MTPVVKVFGSRPRDDGAIDSGAGVGKPPREETAGDGVELFGARYGDLVAADDAAERSRDDPTHWPTPMRLMIERLPA